MAPIPMGHRSAEGDSVVKTVVNLPFPISVNAMYADGKTRRIKSQRYCDWIMEAGLQMNRQRPMPIDGPVNLVLELQEIDDGRKRDCTNFVKGPEDLLVHHGIIRGDHSGVVRSVLSKWSPEVEGCRVTIESIFVPASPTTGGHENERTNNRP